MRSLTDTENRVFSFADRANHLRVLISNDGGTTYENLTDLEGRDWLIGATWGSNIDDPVSQAEVTLRRQADDLSLATLVDGSKLNLNGTLIDIGNEIILEAATTGADLFPTEAEWREIFRGEIDEVDWADNVRLVCRDQGGLLVDTFIEVQRTYGALDGTVLLEDVIQEILDDNINNPGLGSVTLYSVNGTFGDKFLPADSPGFAIRPYTQSKETVMEAIQRLAQLIGYVVKYRWQQNTSAFRLVMLEPERALPAKGTLSFSGQPIDQETFNLNGTTIRAVIGGVITDEFAIESTVEGTANNLVTTLLTGSQAANLEASARHTKALGTLTLTGPMANGNYFTLNNTNYNARVGASLVRSNSQFKAGISAEQTAASIVSVFNGPLSPERSVARAYVDPDNSSAVIFEWRQVGPEGNAIVFTETGGDATADGGGTLGGTQLGGSFVTIEWVRGVAGNSVVFTSSLTNVTVDGAGTLGGTALGRDAKNTPDFTFSQDRYYPPSKMFLSRKDIRNVVKVTPRDPLEQNRRFTVVRQDNTSIAKFGRRTMEITEGSNSQIDTIQEASDFANAALGDLAFPIAEVSIPVPFFWPAEPTDVYTLLANKQHFDTDQTLAVVNIRHTLQPGTAKTLLDLRGQPSGGIKRWLQIQGITGIAPAQDLFEEQSSGTVSAKAAAGILTVEFSDPATQEPAMLDWAFTRIHVVDEDDPNFPDLIPSDLNLAKTVQTLVAEITGLNPQKDYAVKIVHVDVKGNTSVASTVVQRPIESVGPYHENNDREFGLINPNPTFGVFTRLRDDFPPDFWGPNTTSLASWSSSAGDFYWEDTVQKTGATSLRFNSVAAPGGGTNTYLFKSDLIPVDELALYLLEFSWRHDGSGGGDRTAWRTDINYFESDMVTAVAGNPAPLANTLKDYTISALGTVISPANTWVDDRGWFTPPLTARYANIEIRVQVNSAYGQASHPTVYFDHFNMARSRAKLYTGLESDRTLPANTWLEPYLGTLIDNANSWTSGQLIPPVTHQYAIPYDGEYLIHGQVVLDTLTNGSSFLSRLRIDKGGGFADLQYGPEITGAAITPSPTAIVHGTFDLNAGDLIRLQARQNDVSHTMQSSSATMGLRSHLIIEQLAGKR